MKLINTGIAKIAAIIFPNPPRMDLLKITPYAVYYRDEHFVFDGPLPSGQYELLGIASQITEEVARTIVPNYINDGVCRDTGDFHAEEMFPHFVRGGMGSYTAQQSLLSLCTAHNLPPERTVLLGKDCWDKIVKDGPVK